eukprot:16429-Heterococcus_DN1.PRE.1
MRARTSAGAEDLACSSSRAAIALWKCSSVASKSPFLRHSSPDAIAAAPSSGYAGQERGGGHTHPAVTHCATVGSSDPEQSRLHTMPGCCCFRCVSTGNVSVVERLGKFQALAQPGLSVLLYPFDQFVSQISTRVLQLDVSVETKTRDNGTHKPSRIASPCIPLSKICTLTLLLSAVSPLVVIYRGILSKGGACTCRERAVTRSYGRLWIGKRCLTSERTVKLLLQVIDCLEHTLTVQLDAALYMTAMNDDISASKRLREAATIQTEADKIMQRGTRIQSVLQAHILSCITTSQLQAIDSSKPQIHNSAIICVPYRVRYNEPQVKAAEAEAESKYLSRVGVRRQKLYCRLRERLFSRLQQQRFWHYCN